MQLMKDPVTISTGITYDRENIEKWLFSSKNATCPVTKQQLLITDVDHLTPNHTLRRLIQAWCTLNSFERIPTPKTSVEKSQIIKLLNEAQNSSTSQITCLRRLRSIAHRNESSRSHLQAAGAVDFLLSVVRKNEDSSYEALTILQVMDLSDSDLKSFFRGNGEVLNSFMEVLENGNFQDRARTIMLLKSAFKVADPAHLIGSEPELFKQIVHILRDKISQQATKAALKLLMELCPWGRNRIKAVENGAVFVLIDLLLDQTSADRRACELILTVLDLLCGCADGRAELLRHGAGLAVVSKKILRVSHAASERAVRILCSISKYSSNSKVLQEMLHFGVVTKLCFVMQVDAGKRTRERVKEILRLNSRVWKDSSCIPSHLLSSYPS
ncbi:hypothetical protein BUALT_BualtUnG0025300 [Buddleja alternifolia]|uniref:U-box domain-containing protein n=1 Tax=Buddleja alternifolia TaxID=168488 RepID=A0AAV6VZ42_9LAMI|nr:hypothetical protein BUALT_BualtUnG0025300 [Buddleja alternifolia]